MNAAADSSTTDGELRLDGWTNKTTGVGGPLDKSAGFVFTPFFVDSDYSTLEYLYEQDHLSGKIVDALPDAVFRRGWEFTASEEQYKEKVTDECDRLALEERVDQALRWEALYGGAAIFIGAEDGGSVDKPLNPAAVRRVHFLTVFDRWELTPQTYYQSPLNPRFGEPETYRVHPRSMTNQVGMLIHESRLLIFRGRPTTKTNLVANQYWGTSKLVRAFSSLKNYGGALASTLALLADSNQGVFKIKGLAQIILSGKGKTLRERFNAMDQIRSIVNGIVLDADGESYERIATPLTEIANIVDRFKLDVASAAEMPVTVLFGQAPAGLNATGESDMRQWYDRVAQEQRRRVKPALERVIRLVLRSQAGPTSGLEPTKWSVKFPSPWQPTAKEEAEIRKIQADTDAIYVDLQVLTPAQVARARFSGEELTNTVTLKPEELAALEGALESMNAGSSEVDLAPTTMAIVVTVNEARASKGLGPLLNPDGTPNPDGFIPVSEFEAKGKAAGDVTGTGEAQASLPETTQQPHLLTQPVTNDDEEATAEPLSLTEARSLASKMTEASVARCEHGKINRCRLCGIERSRDFVTGPTGEPEWIVSWRAIGDTAPVQTQETEAPQA